MNPESVIHADSLRKTFGSNKVLRGVTFSLCKGETLALLGRNGAGKTTIIRILMGLLKPTDGTIRVEGLDPQQDSLEVRRRVGFLAEDQQMYGWMTVDQLISFIAAFYPTWNHPLASKLVAEYDLNLQQKVRHLSKGQNIRLGLILAMAQSAELMILDDPALALDPIMRKEFNRNLVAHLQESDASLLYSSHLLSEVEAVADRIAILHEGQIVKFADVERMRADVKRLIFPQAHYASVAPRLAVLDIDRTGDDVAVVVDKAEDALSVLSEWEIEPEVLSLNLDEIFEAFVIGSRTDSPQTAVVER